MTFQPIAAPAQISPEQPFPARGDTESELPAPPNLLPTSSVSNWQPTGWQPDWQPVETPHESVPPAVLTVSQPVSPSASHASVSQPPPSHASISMATVQHPLPSHSSPIAQVSATVVAPRVLGRAVPTSPSDLIFSALSSGSPWQLPLLPFDLHSEQYLLTVAPFRGTFEIATGFRIEMIGDAKLCLLPPDASGTPGIFVDYGRVVIRPLQANQSLRIETEKARGVVSVTGTESVLFIDTFAEVSEPSGSTKPLEHHLSHTSTSPILGFVPRHGERIVWHSVSQPQPINVEMLGSVFLQSERYRFGEVQHLPNWLGAMPVSHEDRMQAEICRQYFAEAHGDGEQALTRLTRHESPIVRTLGLRLWGDLGRFDVPIAVMAEGRQGEDAIRHVLQQYFEEVMRRDEETVQRLADAIQIIKGAQRN